MLELRPSCECCDRDLPPESPDARICTYECTFCAACVEDRLRGVCPNCGGGFERRPIRPAAMLVKHPASTVRVFVPEGCGGLEFHPRHGLEANNRSMAHYAEELSDR